MKTAKQRTHLTPEEVQEFINLGVDFGETEMYWNISDCSECVGVLPIDIIIGEWGRLNSSQVDISLVEGKDDSADYCLPAPNLQEVLEVLPKIIMFDEEPYRFGMIFCEELDSWIVEYRCFTERIPCKNPILFEFDDENPFEAIINLLRWVCKNHPETLMRDE